MRSLTPLGTSRPGSIQYSLNPTRPRKKEEARKTFFATAGAPFLDKITDMKKNNRGKWLVGTSFTWADISVALLIEMFELHINPEGMKSYGVLHQLKEDVNSQPGIKEWIIKRRVKRF